MRNLLLITAFFSCCFTISAQDKKSSETKPLTPYISVLAGGCVANPFSFIAGVQKPIQQHINISYDIHYWNTKYECFCDDIYSKGHFVSVTPSVKITYNTGKKGGNGLVAGIGLGYMFAKDRGTEQTYMSDPVTSIKTVSNEIVPGKWDFNSIAPSFSLGVGFRVLKLPVVFNSVYYFAKTTTEGWVAAAGGVGFKIGFKKSE